MCNGGRSSATGNSSSESGMAIDLTESSTELTEPSSELSKTSVDSPKPLVSEYSEGPAVEEETKRKSEWADHLSSMFPTATMEVVKEAVSNALTLEEAANIICDCLSVKGKRIKPILLATFVLKSISIHLWKVL